MVDKRKQLTVYIWNTLGSIFSASSSILLLLIATRLLSVKDSDFFAAAYAISQQLMIIGLFQVRNYQSTDVNEVFNFADYRLTRHLTVTMMLVGYLYFLIVYDYWNSKGLVLLCLTLFRIGDVYSDLYQGYFQQQHRSDFSGKLLFFHSFIAIFSFALSVWLSKSLILGSLTLVIVNTLSVFLIDVFLMERNKTMVSDSHCLIPSRTSVKKILMSCLPLFINGFLITYVFTEPKLVIETLLEQGELPSGSQVQFNILFMPTFALTLLFSVLRPLMTSLADFWEKKQLNTFFAIVRKVSFILIIIGFILLLGAYWLGIPLLELVFGVDLASHQIELVLLLLAGIFNVLATMIDNIMTIFRKQNHLLFVYICTFLVSKLITFKLVKSDGLRGAAVSVLVVMLVYFVLSLMSYIWVLYSSKGLLRRNNESVIDYSSL